MNASTVPWEAASNTPSGGAIWPAGNTSIWSRPPLSSLTTAASRCAEPSITLRAGVQVVGIRHRTFGWAITYGA